MLIGLSGYAQSGKDTVGNYLIEKYGFTRFAFADSLKEMAYILNPIVSFASYKDPVRLKTIVDKQGWDQAKKHEEVRRTLQVLGTEAGRNIIGDNIWVNILADKIEKHVSKPDGPYTGDVVITDCRFVNEANYIKRNGNLWWIERDGVGPLNEHPSENSISQKNADLFIYNYSDFTFLYKQIDALMERER